MRRVLRQLAWSAALLGAACLGGTAAAAEGNTASSASCGADGCTSNACVSKGCAANCGCSTRGCSSCGGLFGHKHTFRQKSECDNCGGLGGGRSRIEGLNPWFNCGCNGSYNFPVPPQATYMWPGMYKRPTMTEYPSPWRFPPLKAYVDEDLDTLPRDFRYDYPALPEAELLPYEREVGASSASAPKLRPVQPVSASYEAPSQRRPGEVEPLSQKLERYYSR